MKFSNFLLYGGVSAFVALGFGCKSESASDKLPVSPVSAVDAAVTIFDCQTQAMQCLGGPGAGAPAPDKIDQCRMGLEQCMGDVQKQIQAENEAFRSCAMDAFQCGMSAKSPTDAMSCRMTFQSCIASAAQAANGTGGTSGAAGSSASGTGGSGASTGGTCIDNQLCILGSHWDSTACKCVPNAGTGGSSASTGGTNASTGGTGAAGRGGRIGDLLACQDTALMCISKATSPDDVRACNDAFRSCAGLPALPPPPMLPTTPGRGPIGGGFGGFGGGLPGFGGFPGGFAGR